jgi:hypothetical protein
MIEKPPVSSTSSAGEKIASAAVEDLARLACGDARRVFRRLATQHHNEKKMY